MPVPGAMVIVMGANDDFNLSYQSLRSATDEQLYRKLNNELDREQAFDPLIVFAEIGRRDSERAMQESQKAVRASNRLAMANTVLAVIAVVVSVIALFAK